MIDGRVEQYGDAGTTSPSLLARVRADDQAAWVRLVGLYAPLVYRWSLRSGLRDEDAADIGQEVFAAVSGHIRAFRRDRPGDSFRGWLYAITRNKIRDRAGAGAEAGEGGSGPGRLERIPAAADESSVWDDRRHLVRRAVELVRGEFEPTTWEAFWRTTVDGQPAEAVAGALGLTRAAVYIARSRVRRRLRAEFEGLVEFEPAAGGETREE